MKKLLNLLFIFKHGKSIVNYLNFHFKKFKRQPLIRLASKVNTDKGYKWHNYIDVYSKIFDNQRLEIKSILEIGLLQHDIQKKTTGNIFYEAPSLWVWKEYFRNANIYGFDLKEFPIEIDTRVKIIQGDQSSRSDLKKVIYLESEFDIIIDDALHASKHQQISFSYLFKFLKPGGYYIIEDLQFQPFEHEENDSITTKQLLREFLISSKWNSKYSSVEEQNYINSNIKNIYFFNSSKEYENKFHGTDALVIIVKK